MHNTMHNAMSVFTFFYRQMQSISSLVFYYTVTLRPLGLTFGIGLVHDPPGLFRSWHLVYSATQRLVAPCAPFFAESGPRILISSLIAAGFRRNFRGIIISCVSCLGLLTAVRSTVTCAPASLNALAAFSSQPSRRCLATSPGSAFVAAKWGFVAQGIRALVANLWDIIFSFSFLYPQNSTKRVGC